MPRRGIAESHGNSTFNFSGTAQLFSGKLFLMGEIEGVKTQRHDANKGQWGHRLAWNQECKWRVGGGP